MDRVMKLKAEIEEIRALLNNAAADIGSIQCNLKRIDGVGYRYFRRFVFKCNLCRTLKELCRNKFKIHMEKIK